MAARSSRLRDALTRAEISTSSAGGASELWRREPSKTRFTHIRSVYRNICFGEMKNDLHGKRKLDLKRYIKQIQFVCLYGI